jgi:hypothetical protein
MPVYRVVFANNIVVSCGEDQNKTPSTDIHFEKDSQGRLMFAYITAADMLQAVVKANELVEKTLSSVQ